MALISRDAEHLFLASSWPFFHSAAVPWPTSVDVSLFRAINQGLSNPFFDWLMPIFAWNAFFVPLLLLGGVALVWKGGPRGRIFVLLLALIIAMGDGLVINTIKHALERPRPHEVIADANLLVGRGSSASMPSSHTATWFAGMLIALLFYRRTIWFMLPLAITMAFSRVYVGAHYPSDVVVGTLLGLGYAAAGWCSRNGSGAVAGPRLAPEWFRQTPVLVQASRVSAPVDTPVQLDDRSYLRLGYVIIAGIFIARLLYLGSDTIQLSEDEAYQWLWSKHLALSYYSKPPMIAYAQWLGTSLWGDTEFGVRFLSPVIAAILALILLRFFARQGNARAGFWLILILNCTPLLAVGIHAADGGSAARFVLDRSTRDGMESRAGGRHNEGLGLDGTLDGPGFPEQVHGSISDRVLCDLFSAATRRAYSFAPVWSVSCARHRGALHRPGDHLECAAQLGDGGTRCQQRDAQRGVEAVQVLRRISRR